ncbi:MAG: DUF373 family protein [Nitrososphaerales archaeon]
MGTEQKSSKLLVLSVDRDDDVGVKARIKTPIIGKDNCIEAAKKLAIADPEEADANAIFAAVKQYDELLNKNYECEVAIITGSHEGGVLADQKLRAELMDVISKFNANGVILVSDGYEDREVLPILMSVIPIVSIRRVVIKHSERIEESYAVLGRYIRMLFTDSRYSKFSLGIPGMLLMAIGLLSIFNLLQLAIQVILIFLGIVLMIWGFDLTKYILSIRHLKRISSYIRFFSIIATILVISVAFYQGYSSSMGKETIPLFLSSFIEKSLPLIWVGFSIYLGYSLIFHWIRKSIKIWQNILAFVMLVFLYMPLLEFSRILINPSQNPFTLILQLLLGLVVTSIVAVIAYRDIRSRKRTGDEG